MNIVETSPRMAVTQQTEICTYYCGLKWSSDAVICFIIRLIQISIFKMRTVWGTRLCSYSVFAGCSGKVDILHRCKCCIFCTNNRSLTKIQQLHTFFIFHIYHEDYYFWRCNGSFCLAKHFPTLCARCVYTHTHNIVHISVSLLLHVNTRML